jgi:hypothetical protein
MIHNIEAQTSEHGINTSKGRDSQTAVIVDESQTGTLQQSRKEIIKGTDHATSSQGIQLNSHSEAVQEHDTPQQPGRHP